MKIFYLCGIVILLFSACHKDKNIPPEPSADFSLSGIEPGAPLVAATFDHATLVSKVSNTDTYAWDLGDGRKGNTQNSYIDYAKPGNYQITFMATGSSGQNKTVTKSITVFGRELKKVIIDSLNWGGRVSYPSFRSKADVWVEIMRGDSHTSYPYSSELGTHIAPIIYKSPVLYNMSPDAKNIAFDIKDKILIDEALFDDQGYHGIGYLFNLYARKNGHTILLSSTYMFGISYQQSLTARTFNIQSGLLKMKCDLD